VLNSTWHPLLRYNSPVSILSFPDARRAVERFAASVIASRTERLDLAQARDRVLASTVIADRDLPPFPRSARDGYAVRSSDISRAPAKLSFAGEIRAGADPASVCPHLEPGYAVGIMTGAAVPSGADTVVMVEYTSRPDETSVLIDRSTIAGENIVPAGSEAPSGATLLNRGTRLDFAAIATAASVGHMEVEVFQRPRVAILSTGDEVVEASARPGPYQIRNSNAHSLEAQISAAGGKPIILPIAPDEQLSLARLIAEGLRHDLLLITGGVSAGKYDLVEPALEEFRASFHFTGANIQPGKPVVFAEVAVSDRNVPVFGLPGNPVSTMVCFDLFVRPVLDGLCGARVRPLVFPQARLASDIRRKVGLTRFLPGILSGSLSDSVVDLVHWQGSGDVVATARSNCYIVVPPDHEHIAGGEYVSILLRGVDL
jgi:molybdopterin molybdotransferase